MAVLDGVRSYLFVPASDPSGSTRRSRARRTRSSSTSRTPSRPRPRRRPARSSPSSSARGARTASQLVRVNGLETPHGAADFAALDGLAVDAIVVPKAEPPRCWRRARPVGSAGRRAHRDGPRAARARTRSRAHPRVVALMLGNVDLAAELGATPGPDGRELLFARSALVVDSIAAGLGGPIDGPCIAIGDDGRAARRDGRGEGARLRGEGVHPPAPARRRPRRLRADRRGARLGAARRRRRRGAGAAAAAPSRRRADGRRAGGRPRAPPARGVTRRSVEDLAQGGARPSTRPRGRSRRTDRGPG